MSKGYQLTVKAVKLCVEDFKIRWDQQAQDLEVLLKFDYVDIKQRISNTLSAKVTERVGNNPDSFLNQVIVPGVSMAGAKRLWRKLKTTQWRLIIAPTS